ncbi:MAG: nitronate monooxygenase [Victivallales bacterium]|nr:nitronate monooxygenase [Victivallales bacterium]
MNNITALPDLQIGNIRINPPVIQGGMGVLVSGPGLVSAVSNAGALGILAAVGAGEDCEDRSLNYADRSSEGLRQMIAKTRSMTSNPFGINIMCVLSNYVELVRTAIEEKISVIISGAGLPLSLPSLAVGSETALVPVVSTARAADLICRTWKRRYDRLPDAIIVEGSKAGGHLGFSRDEIDSAPPELIDIVKDVIKVVKPYQVEGKATIPVIAAGGVFDGKDIATFMNVGAAGVQMGTRFVCTDECDASIEYKNSYVNCSEDDITIVQSPVGLPLRVVRNDFIKRIQAGGKDDFYCRYQCLRTCDPSKSSYCIADALKNAFDGNMNKGFTTCGANAYRINKIVPVRELLNELAEGCLEHLNPSLVESDLCTS